MVHFNDRKSGICGSLMLYSHHVDGDGQLVPNARRGSPKQDILRKAMAVCSQDYPVILPELR
jgi:hypothetical protein